MASSRSAPAITFTTLVCAAALAAFALGACGDDDGSAQRPGADASADGPLVNVDADAATTSELDAGDGGPDADAADPVDATVDPGPCNARVEVAPILESPHVADGTPIVYAANPPSSGPHYNSWANFQELTRPVDDGYLVHSLEHGGVLLLHACAPGPACDAIVSGLRSVRDAIPTDPSCSPAIRVRAVIASRAANTSAVHVVAWGHVYRADCVDPPSIASFIAAHYAKGPEDICIQGQVF